MSYRDDLEQYLESEEGQKALDLTTIGTHPQYLRNRLIRAFEFGYASGRRQTEKHTVDRLQALLFDSQG